MYIILVKLPFKKTKYNIYINNLKIIILCTFKNNFENCLLLNEKLVILEIYIKRKLLIRET